MDTIGPIDVLVFVTAIGWLSSVIASFVSIRKQSSVFRLRKNGVLRIAAAALVRHEGLRLVAQSTMLYVATAMSGISESQLLDETMTVLKGITWVSIVVTFTTWHDMYVKHLISKAEHDPKEWSMGPDQ